MNKQELLQLIQLIKESTKAIMTNEEADSTTIESETVTSK